jgi:insulysin
MDSRPREADAPTEAADGAAAPAIAQVEVEVTKPRNDKRGYRRVVLPNALECLLISDPDTDKVKLRRRLFDQDWGRGFCGSCWVSPRF